MEHRNDKPEKAEEPQAHEGMEINSLATPRKQLRGSLPLSRHRNGEGNGGGKGGDGPGSSAPDIAFQLVSQQLPANLKVDDLTKILKTAIDSQGSDPGSCSGGSGGQSYNSDIRVQHQPVATQDTVVLGVWLQQPRTEKDSEARDNGMQQVDILDNTQGGDGQLKEWFAIFLNASMIINLAHARWTPVRLDKQGNPDPNGPIHITTLTSVDFNPGANAIVTQVAGFDEETWPAINFSITITDAFVPTRLAVKPPVIQLSVDPSLLVILGVIALGFSVLTWPLAIFFIGEAFIASNQPSPSSGQGGVGSQIAKNGSMIPQSIPIPGGFKAQLNYTRTTIGTGGLVVAGRFEPAIRMPTVTIVGPTEVAGPALESAEGKYSFTYTDARSPIALKWATDSNDTIFNPAGCSTLISFDLSNAKTGEVLGRDVSVQITDADQVTASGHMSVRVRAYRPSSNRN